MKRFVALLAAALMLAGGAHGDDASSTKPANISGQWTFKAYTYDSCDFGGVAELSTTEEPGVYACELTARQVCPINEIEWVVRQSCIATRTDDRLTIRSTIEEFLVGEPTPAYWPDNFILKIRSSDRMTGSLISHGTHASEFTRQVGGIS